MLSGGIINEKKLTIHLGKTEAAPPVSPPVGGTKGGERMKLTRHFDYAVPAVRRPSLTAKSKGSDHGFIRCPLTGRETVMPPLTPIAGVSCPRQSYRSVLSKPHFLTPRTDV